MLWGAMTAEGRRGAGGSAAAGGNMEAGHPWVLRCPWVLGGGIGAGGEGMAARGL